MNNQQKWLTIILLVSLVIFNIWMIGFGKQPWIISSLNIFFHEAGHVIFGVFGRFIGVLGGTLGELLVPSMFLFYFHNERNIPGQVFGLWWLSVALYDVAIYLADARAQILPLVGGPGAHDWFYLLGKMRLLDYDIQLSKILIITALTVTVYMAVLVHRYYELTKGKDIN